MIFSCIIPAFNEGTHITKVIETALACNEIDELIIVDDGSTDNTWEIIGSFTHPKLQKIHLKQNLGKLGAFFIGLGVSSGDTIVMIDADYIGLLPEHIAQLIEPVKNRKIDSTMMMWSESFWICKLLKHDLFSGMRVLPKEVFSDKKYYLSGSGFALETKINEIVFQKKISVRSFYFREIHNPSKGWKQAYWKQPRDILHSLPLWRIIQHAWYIYRQQP